MPDQMELTDILADKKPVVPAAPAVQPEGGDVPRETMPPESARQRHRAKEEEARAEGEGKVRDPETGQFVAKPKEPEKTKEPEKIKAEPVKQEFTEKERAFLMAAQEERRKRQDLERRLAELERPKPAAPAEPAKTFWDDPEGFFKSFEERVKQTANTAAETANQTATQTRLATAEMIARTKHTDFDDRIAVFSEVVKSTPGLAAQWLAASDPAEFAYQTGKNYAELREVGDIPALKAKIEKELRLKIEEELRAKAEQLASERAKLPATLSDAHAAPVSRVQWTGPTSLSDILKH